MNEKSNCIRRAKNKYCEIRVNSNLTNRNIYKKIIFENRIDDIDIFEIINV